MPTPSETLNIAKVSLWLATADVQNSALFPKNLMPNLPIVLAIVIKDLEFGVDNYSATDPDLIYVSNFVYALCGQYRFTAAAIVSNGGGSTTPTTPVLTLNPYQFIVSNSSTIPTGGDSITLNTLGNSYVGYNIIFIRNGITQSTVNDGGTYYSWNSTTAQFQCIGVAAEGELFQIFAVL